MTHDVNKTGIQFADMRFGRENLDENFLDIRDDLNAAWYAADFAKYNRLHGVLWTLYNFVFDQLNLERPPGRRISPDRYRFKEPDELGGPRIDDHEGYKQILLEHPTETTELKAAIETKFGRTFEWP